MQESVSKEEKLSYASGMWSWLRYELMIYVNASTLQLDLRPMRVLKIIFSAQISRESSKFVMMMTLASGIFLNFAVGFF